MAQPLPEERSTVDQVLKLVSQLTPESQEEIIEQIKLQWLRQEVQKGIDQADRGELLDADEAFAELEKRYQHQNRGKNNDK
jgi:predicted transcriptional regulator